MGGDERAVGGRRPTDIDRRRVRIQRLARLRPRPIRVNRARVPSGWTTTSTSSPRGRWRDIRSFEPIHSGGSSRAGIPKWWSCAATRRRSPAPRRSAADSPPCGRMFPNPASDPRPPRAVYPARRVLRVGRRPLRVLIVDGILFATVYCHASPRPYRRAPSPFPRPIGAELACRVARDMKAVILAGGLGTRISEETVVRPKPMVEIGGKPILWHIMKGYSAHGIHDFIICCGYKGYVIKEYFANYFLHMSDVTFDMRSNAMEVHQKHVEPWRVTLVDTGEQTMTGGRLKRVRSYVGDADFCMTYGDGVSDVDIAELLRFHAESGRLATVTAVQPPGRFGALDVRGRRGAQLRREAARRRRLDQRRLLRPLAQGARLHRGRRHGLGARADGAARGEGQLARLRAPRLLAADGHAARQDAARGAVAIGQGAVEGRGHESRRSGGTAASSSPATPASRAAGCRCGCRRWARR